MATPSNHALAQNLEQLVAAFVQSSHELVLAAVAQAMDTRPVAPASTARSKAKPSKRASSSKRAKPSQRRTPTELAELGERFYEVLCEHPGEAMIILAAKVGATPRELSRSVTLLKRAGRVRSVGQRGAMRYFPTARSAKAA
jgi:hypothetical protein